MTLEHKSVLETFIIQSIDAKSIYFPTAAIAKIDFQLNNWNDLDFASGDLDFLTNPLELNNK